MFIVKAFIKILSFFLARPVLLFLAFAIAVIVRWYFWGGIFSAIFIGIILFFISLFILGIHTKKTLDDSKSETLIESDEEGIKAIHSQVPTHIISRNDGRNTEHVILSKHTKLPQKITYE